MTENIFVQEQVLFLKSKYPCGYNVNCIINSKICVDNKKKMLINQLKEIDSSAKIKISSKSILSINFNGTGGMIFRVFKLLDIIKNDYGIEDYTVSTTTLEDVFLKLNDGSNDLFTNPIDSKDKAKDENKIINENEINSTDDSQNNLINIPVHSFAQSNSNLISQIKSHIKRNVKTLTNSKLNFFLEIASAGFLLIFSLLGLKILVLSLLQSSINFEELLYSQPIYIIMNEELKDMILKSSYVKHFNNKIDFQNYSYKLSDEEYNTFNAEQLALHYNSSSQYSNARSIILVRQSKQYQSEIINLYHPSGDYYFHVNNEYYLSSYL